MPGPTDRRGYLLPVDADPDQPELTGYSLDTLFENLRDIPAKSITVFLDACFSGESQAGTLFDKASPFGIDIQVPAIGDRIGILTAAGGGELAHWDPMAQHGLFTAYLLRAVYGLADQVPWGNADGQVTLGETAKYLNDEMRYCARRSYLRDQTPTLSGRADLPLATVLRSGRVPLPVEFGLCLDGVPAPGTVFRDCSDCPEMVMLPRGDFLMGVPLNVAERENPEYPPDRVEIDYDVAIGRFEISVGEFAEFVQSTGYEAAQQCEVIGQLEHAIPSRSWRSPGFPQNALHPVVCVTLTDAKAYTAWLSEKTGKDYRLPTEVEWEYMARAGTTTAWHWGDSDVRACQYANLDDLTLNEAYPTFAASNCRDGFVYTAPVGSFEPNSFGVFDSIGNAFELLHDRYSCTRRRRLLGHCIENNECEGCNPAASGAGWSGALGFLRFLRAYPNAFYPKRGSADTGFRVVRTFP